MTGSHSASTIGLELDMLEAVLDRSGATNHEAAVLRAERIDDEPMADFLRAEAAPAFIRGRIAVIRDCIAAGELEDASRENQMLRKRLDLIERIVRAPVLATGLKIQRSNAARRDAYNYARHRQSAANAAEWQREANEVWQRSPHLSKNAVARHIESKLSPTEKAATIAGKIKKPQIAS